MARKSTQKTQQAWAEAEADILARLDIRAEYEALGVKFTQSQPSASGWLTCYAIGRDDSTPSAGVCVGGDSIGRYRDFGGGGTSQGFWDFAAAHGAFSDWRAARKHFGDQTGVELPKTDDQLLRDEFALSEMQYGVAMTFASAKPPVTGQAISEAGGMIGRWPLALSLEAQNPLITFHMYGAQLLSGEVVGYHSVGQAAKKIRIWRGKDSSPDLVKTMTKGTPGLMNEHALRRLPEAEVVWLVEGVTDMLAMQATIPADIPHVVTSLGSASYAITPELAATLKGKTVYVVGDIDRNGTGLIGAKQKAAVIAQFARETRVVVLPFEPDDPRSDIRDFLNQGDEYDYDALLKLAAAADILTAERAALEGMSGHQAILHRLGCVVCGQIEGTEYIEIFSRRLRKSHTIKEIDRFSTTKAILAFGGEAVDEVIWDSPEEPPPGKHTIFEVRNAIAREAAANYLDADDPIGLGVWRAGEDKLVMVGRREADVYDGTMKLERIEAPFVNSRRIQFGSFRWYDRAKFVDCLAKAESTEWCTDVVMEAMTYFEQWDNWTYPSTPELITGLIGATWVQSIWPWRPHVTVTGSSGSGKSALLEKSIPHIFGRLGSLILKPTDAGIRQFVGHTSRMILIDEFEDDKNRKRVLELLRTANGGQAVIPRGTIHGHGTQTKLNHMVWIAGIETGLQAAADRNRFIFLELNKRKKGAPAKIVIPSHEELEDLGLRILACMVRRWRLALATWRQLRAEKLGIDSRIIESHAVPVAALAAMGNLPYSSALDILQKHLDERADGIQQQQESDEEVLLDEILESHLRMKDGTHEPVAKLLRGAFVSSEHNEILEAHGLRWLHTKDDEDFVFLLPSMIQRHVLKTTRDTKQILLRIDGAKAHKAKIAGKNCNGVTIPSELILDEENPQMF